LTNISASTGAKPSLRQVTPRFMDLTDPDLSKVNPRGNLVTYLFAVTELTNFFKRLVSAFQGAVAGEAGSEHEDSPLACPSSGLNARLLA
jgi:hypothetical protein